MVVVVRGGLRRMVICVVGREVTLTVGPGVTTGPARPKKAMEPESEQGLEGVERITGLRSLEEVEHDL